MENINHGEIVKKHVATIHCANRLSLLERKISNALLYYAFDNLTLLETHEISIKQLCRLIHYKGNNHEVIKEASKNLMTTIVEWNVISEQSGKEKWKASSLLACAEIDGGTLRYAYSPLMRELLHHPAVFAKINLRIQSKFKSSYGLALYENCIRYLNIGCTKWFSVSVFRKLMGVTDEQYPIFRDFKKRVIDKAILEVNTYSDLYLTVEYQKERRQVVSLKFLIVESKASPLNASTPDSEQYENLIKSLCQNFSFTATSAKKLTINYSSDLISKTIDYLLGLASFKAGKIQNVQGYLTTLLRDGICENTNSSDVVEKKRIAYDARMKKMQEGELQARASIQHLIEIGYLRVIAHFSHYGISKRERLLNNFAAFLDVSRNYVIAQRFNQNGLDDTIVQKEFTAFLLNNKIISLTSDQNDSVEVKELV